MIRSLLRSLLATLRGERPSADDSAPNDEDGPPDAADADGRPADRSDDSDGAVWDLIPRRQYDGPHAESGGLTRGEQERALDDIQRRADAIETDEELDPGSER